MHQQKYGKSWHSPRLNLWNTTDTSEYAHEEVQHIKLLFYGTKSHSLSPWLDQEEPSDEKKKIVLPLQATSFSGREASV